MRQKLIKRTLVLAAVLLVAAALSTPAARDTRQAQAAPAEPLPADGLTREQLVGHFAGLAGGQFQPPACVSDQEMFTDVPASSPFCPWIEELARRGITTGCTATEYCPSSPVTRSQMAVFVVKAMETCPTLDPTDEMIRVGGVCIDKYEASIWDAPVGGNQITNETPIPCSEDGQDCFGVIFARSVAGVEPRREITWFQAQSALANVGKRLPTSAEWQMAVQGTDEGTSNPEDCVRGGVAPDVTGARENCVSDWGAFDMVGNLKEWVADWVPHSSSACPGWGPFSDDLMCLSGVNTVQGPGALSRGGSFGSSINAGPFAVSGTEVPQIAFALVGFRGAR